MNSGDRAVLDVVRRLAEILKTSDTADFGEDDPHCHETFDEADRLSLDDLISDIDALAGGNNKP